MVVSMLNIEEVPELVHNAAAVGVDEVMIIFSRYFPDEIYPVNNSGMIKDEDSMFFHKSKYDETIRNARRTASRHGIHLRYEPMFSQRFRPQPCYQPWNTLVVDWNGTVYPCTGGEIWFRKQVQERKYDFGNLLSNHISDFWNNESYTKLRRTISKYTSDNFMAECTNCHNLACYKGPDHKEAHILEPPN